MCRLYSKIKCVLFNKENDLNHKGQEGSGGGGLLKLAVDMLVLS